MCIHTHHFFPSSCFWDKSMLITKGFSSERMEKLDHEEGHALKNWCFRTMVLEKTLESPLYYKEIKPVHPKGNQSWIFIGRTDAEAEAPTLWPPDAKIQLTGKDPDAGKDWGQEEKRTTEDEMVGWHHWFNGHDFEQTLEDSEGQGSPACCSPWSWKESDHNLETEQHSVSFPIHILPMWILGCFLSVALVTVTVLLWNLFPKVPIRTFLV